MKEKKLGTFAGVFTPSVLTILGIILFLRVGFIVGEAGLLRAIMIICLANLISVCTTFSLSAIATNFRVKAGGDYYLISRTLGVEFGGAIGVVLFLAQSVSIAFYVIGFGEALSAVIGSTDQALPQIAAFIALSILFIFAWLGSDWATKLQYVIMSVLTLAIITFFIGGFEKWNGEIFTNGWAPAGVTPFWVLFALFFPAVTGFTQGVSMSGDLKDPGKSLPLGTFVAVGLSWLIYIGVAFVLAGAMSGADLVADYNAMRKISLFPFMVDAGVICATLSSALASFLGAPRILQSLASDRIFKILNPFAVGAGPTSNPRRGVLLAAVIAIFTVLIGDLNLIAPIVTMFFLLSYGLLNYATYYEASSKSPSFRPRFRWYHPRVSLLGGLGCLGAILAIDPTAGVVSFVFLMAIYQYIKSSDHPERWADSSRSNRFQRIRANLFKMSYELEHSRDWRPVILAFSDNLERRERIIRFASWIEGGSGVTTAVRILEGEGALVRKKRLEMEEELRKEIEDRELDAFALVVNFSNGEVGFPVLLQAAGLGPIRANTILLNWYDQDKGEKGIEGLKSYGKFLRGSVRFGCNVVVLATGSDTFKKLSLDSSARTRIDVWWRDDATSKLNLMLAYLMTRTPEWSGAEIRVLAAVHSAQVEQDRITQINEMLSDVRIDAEVEVVETISNEIIIQFSSKSSLVFAPFRLKDDGPIGIDETSLDDLVNKIPVLAMVLAAQDIELTSEPDEGKHGEIASAMDKVAKAESRVKHSEKEFEKCTVTYEKAKDDLIKAEAANSDEVESLKEGLNKAEDDLNEANKALAKGRFTLDTALEKEGKALGEDVESKI